MRALLPFASLALLCFHASISAQSGPVGSSRPTTDTLTFEFSGLPQAPGKTFRSQMIRSSEPGDLGTHRVDSGHRRTDDGVLVMTRNGHPMRYVRH